MTPCPRLGNYSFSHSLATGFTRIAADIKMSSASARNLFARTGGQIELLKRSQSAGCFNNAILSLNFAPNSKPIVPEDASRLLIASIVASRGRGIAKSSQRTALGR